MASMIQGSVIFVTGSNRGIGRAFVEVAVEQKAKRVYAAARDTSQLDDLKNQFADIIVPVKLDVTDDEDIAKAAALATDVQVLINNAGVAGISGALTAESTDAAQAEMNVNYFGLLKVSKAFSRSLIKNSPSAIINIVSVAGLINFPFAATYSASKVAAHSLTQAIRAELRPHNVFVQGVYPGPVDTDMAKSLDFEKAKPHDVVNEVFQSLAEAKEDVFPDAFAKNFVATLIKDPKGLEIEHQASAHPLVL